MNQVDPAFPLPQLIINKNYKIKSFTEEAKEIFGQPSDLLELVDEDSILKVKQWVTPEHAKASLEVLVRPPSYSSTPLTVDMHVVWEGELYAHVLIILKDEKLTKITNTLSQLRTRLNDTNLELLEEKEKLEEAMHQNNRLSAPFIKLTEESGLVPLFGDLNNDKIRAIEDSLLYTVRTKDVDRVLIDFTAVGDMQQEGIAGLKQIMTSLFYMGTELIIIGIQPRQAMLLHRMDAPLQVIYMNSLEQALDKYDI
ncbi:STAS domain-containing protein [Halobacillus ihumii]|uniref:STAS domain-containing protein n=1 Tax=Halobacillus ihumii TaxID=2686092 RepID=UPI0013D1F687|nr:STAS domain-containing protein [Halobacillus ihumii]